MTRLMIRTSVILTVFLTATQAFAHHPGHVRQGSTETPLLAAQFTVEHANFDILSRKGTWTRMSLEAAYAPLEWLSFTANLPFAWVREAQKDEVFGLTDMELGVMFEPFSATSRRFGFKVGMQVELPTGSVDGGLGGGHLALIPKVLGHIKASEAVDVVGELFVASALGAHAHAPGSWHSMLAIHSMHELGARLGARYTDPRFTLGVGLSTLQGLSGPQASGPSSARVEGTVTLVDDWMLTTDFEIPFAGERRTDWRVSLGIGWRFNPEDDANCGCEATDGCGCAGGCEECG